MCDANDLLHSLCQDLQSIVHRYLHMYTYLLVRKQYRDKWLNDPGTFERIYWDDAGQCFVIQITNMCRVANHRDRNWTLEDRDIHNMYDYDYDTSVRGSLPRKYY